MLAFNVMESAISRYPGGDEVKRRPW